MKITSIIGLSLMISSVAMSQQVEKDTTQKLETIQVTAAAPPVKTATAITNTQLLQEIPAALSLQPGVFMTSDAGSGFGYTYLYVRGMDQTRLAVTLNGMPMADPEDQGFYSSNIPNLLGSTHLSLSPGIAGSGGGVVGLAGQLNITTLNPWIIPSGVIGTVSVGSFGTQQQSLQFSSGQSSLTITNQHSNGYKYGAYEEGKSAIGSTSRNIGLWTLTATELFGDVRHGSAWDAQPLSTAIREPRTNDLSGLGEHFQEAIGQLQIQGPIGQNDKLSITMMGNWINGSYDVPSSPTVDLSVNQRWLQNAITWEHDTIFSAGTLVSIDHRIHSSFVKDSDDVLYQNVGDKSEETGWARMAFNFSGFKLIPELQIRHATFVYTPSLSGGTFDPQSWTFVNPKLAITKQLSNHFITRLNLAYTNREPSRSDLFAGADDIDPTLSAALRSNPVKPEELVSTEAGVEYITHKVLLNLNVYNMAFHNQIMPNGPLSVSGIPLRQNVSNSYRRGIEVGGRWQIAPTFAIGLSGEIEDARIQTWNDATTGEHAINTTALLTPPFIAHASIEKKIGKLLVSYVHTERGYMFLSNTEDPINRLGATRWDDASAQLSPSRNLDIKLSVANLGNSFVTTGGYAGTTEPYVYVMARRSFNVQITVR